jgi:hypothetical protein
VERENKSPAPFKNESPKRKGFAMSCSLIVVEGVRKYTDQEALEFARIAGLNFIKLKHIHSGSGERGQRGFQSVVIRIVTDRDGGKKYTWEGSFDRIDKTPCMGQRQLTFHSEKHTGFLVADLPDTPYNRNVLVTCYLNNAQWKIIDPVLDAEIREKAEELQKSIPNKPSAEQVVVGLEEKNRGLEDEVRRLKQQLDFNNATQEIIKEATTPSTEDSTGVLGLSVAGEKKLREEAKKEVYEEMSVRLKEIQDSKGRAWTSSKEYREEIIPVVEARFQKKLEEKYANNNVGTGSDN